MQIINDKVVSFSYTLKDEQDNILDISDKNEPLLYIHGHENLIPGLEKAFESKKGGDSFQVTVPPEEGYGIYDDELVISVDKSELEMDEELQVGLEVEAHSDEGVDIYTIIKIDGDTVILDGNHPLAGKTLNFDITVLDVRDATEEEKEHGHVHDEHGHHDGESCC